ncbi:MAG TPA: hypothetical protein DCQ98_17625 [Planctomycetaceae bacterium]|nr:hypothetical protein [Planctomycetaceae bacterium]
MPMSELRLLPSRQARFARFVGSGRSVRGATRSGSVTRRQVKLGEQAPRGFPRGRRARSLVLLSTSVRWTDADRRSSTVLGELDGSAEIRPLDDRDSTRKRSTAGRSMDSREHEAPGANECRGTTRASVVIASRRRSSLGRTIPL